MDITNIKLPKTSTKDSQIKNINLKKTCKTGSFLAVSFTCCSFGVLIKYCSSTLWTSKNQWCGF